MLLVMYLSKTLGFKPQLRDHSYTLPESLNEKIPQHLEEHNYTLTEEKIHEKHKESLMIPMQYADDCG